MKIEQRKRVAQKLWGWICLSINCLIMTLLLSKQAADYLPLGIMLSLFILCYGIVKTLNDKNKDDLSGVSVVIEYICLYIITFLSAFKISENLLSVTPLVLLAIISIIELLIFVLITYWYAIRNYFRKKRKTA